MKGYKNLVPIALVVCMLLSVYMLYNTRVAVVNEYNQYLATARDCVEKGVEVDAIQNYQKALALKNTLELQLEVGQYCLQLEDDATAIAWGERMVSEYPEEAQAYEYLLGVYVARQDYNRSYSLNNTIVKRGITSTKIESLLKEIEYVYFWGASYDDVSVYSNGYCGVLTEEKWGYANETGEKVIATQLGACGPFINDLAPVQTVEKESYFVDYEGNKKVPVQNIKNITSLKPYTGKVFAASSGEAWAFYDVDSKKVSEDFEDVSTMGNGIAAVKKGGYWYLIDDSMNRVNDYKYASVVQDEKGIVYRNEVLFVNENGQYELVDKSGKKITNTQYLDAKMFIDTYAAVKTSKGWTFIDNTGKQVIKDYYDDARSFSNGFAAVKKNGKWGFINEKGNLAIDFLFEDAKDFNASGGVFVKKDVIWTMLRLYSKNYAS